MPRRTRRSEELSAAVQPENASAETAATNEVTDSGVVEESQVSPVRHRQPRRRPPTKKVEALGEVEQSTDDSVDSPATDETASRRTTRRSPRSTRVPIATQVVNEAEPPTAPESDGAKDAPATETTRPIERGSHRPPPPLRRRVGGRRTVAEAAAVVEGTEATDAAPISEAPTTASTTSRNRRRRGNKRPESTVSEQSSVVEPIEDIGEALLLDLALDTETAAEESGTTEEERKRSRRSRRGGRRRSGRPSGVESSDESEVESAVELDDIDGDFPVLSAPLPPWSAPRLVPTAEELGLASFELKTTAKLSESGPGFLINGTFYSPELFFVNSETSDDPAVVSSQIRLAAEHGVHIHSGVAYLPLKNAFGVRSFTSVQTLIKQILDSDPDGYILVRLQCVPTNFWARTHPDEMAVYSDGSNGDVSFASREFWQDTVEALAALVQFLADPETIGGDRIIGLHIDKGEWFNDANAGYDFSAPSKLAFREWLHERYQTAYALRAAWFSGTAEFETADIPKWPGTPASRKKEEVVLYNRPRERRYVDYNAFTSDLMAQAISGVAEAIKWLSQGKLLVGASYGYTFEFATRNDSGHQALTKVLASPYVDIVAGPNSYTTRQAGGAGSFSSPVDSAHLHGKLWIVEDDTKTYLAADETEDAFNPKVATIQDTVSVLRRNASAALVHGCGICWMDLWGNGWLNSPEIWAEITELRQQSVAARRVLGDTNPVPEVAILVDEASYNYIVGDPSGGALQAGLITKSRELIYRSGASVGFYLQSDVALLPDAIKLYIFLNPLRVTTQERQSIREKLQKPGKTLAWLYAPGLFDERGDSQTEVSEIVGMPLKAQPWNSHIGTIFTEERHPVTERLHGGKRLGSDEILNPSYAVADPAAIVLGEYAQSGAPSIASKINEGGWKSVFIGEPHLTGELLRGLYRFAGIHVYEVQDDIVHASSAGVILVHSPYTGQRTIHLPKPSAVYSVYEHRLVTQSASTFRAFMRGRATNFFLWGDLEKIATALGTTSDALKEQQAAWKAEREGNQQRNPRGQSSRDSSYTEADSSGEYGSSDDQDSLQDEIVQVEQIVDQSVVATISPEAGVSVLIESGLIAGDIDILDADLEFETVEEEQPVAEGAPIRSEAMSPSRRRRWNRKRNMQAAKSSSPPVISMEDLLSDLPPRKPLPPKSEE